MLLGLLGYDVDQVVVVEHARKLEQRCRDVVRVVGELHDHVAGRPFERGQQFCHVGAGLDLDQFRELAEHVVVLRDLLVVAAIGNEGVELCHVAEELVPLRYVRVPVQDPERREGPAAFFHFLHNSGLPGFCRYRTTLAGNLSA